MKILLVFLLTALTARGQAPSWIEGSEYAYDAPELKALVVWAPVPGATAYNIYETQNPKLRAADCPPLVFDHSTTDTFYLDNPNPGWYRIPVTDGHWKARVWCYSVSAVVNGKESAQTPPVSIAIGESGYLSFSMRTPGTVVPNSPCAEAVPIIPFPLTANQISIKLIYRQAGDTVEHEIPISPLIFSPYGQPAKYSSVEIEWKIPVTALDGTPVPWNTTDSYFARVFIPGHQYVVTWSPKYNRDMSFYNQASVQFLTTGEQCPYYGGSSQTNFWENIIITR